MREWGAPLRKPVGQMFSFSFLSDNTWAYDLDLAKPLLPLRTKPYRSVSGVEAGVWQQYPWLLFWSLVIQASGKFCELPEILFR